MLLSKTWSHIFHLHHPKTIPIWKHGNCNPIIYIYINMREMRFAFTTTEWIIFQHILLHQPKHVNPHHMIMNVETYLTKTIETCWYASHDHLSIDYHAIVVQQGRARQLLLDWLTLAERNRLTSCAVALCREVQWARAMVRKNTQRKD